MDRGLFVKGSYLLETWEGLTVEHLNGIINKCFPVAFLEIVSGYFGAFPVNIFCVGEIIHTQPLATKTCLHHMHVFGGAFTRAGNQKFVEELNFDILTIDEYLTKQNFHILQEKYPEWDFRINIALISAINTIPDKYTRHIPRYLTTDFRAYDDRHAIISNNEKIVESKEGYDEKQKNETFDIPNPGSLKTLQANTVASQSDDINTEEHETIRKWRIALENADIEDISKTCITILLDRLEGTKLSVLEEQHKGRNVSRDIAEGQSIDVPLLLEVFPDLPPLRRLSIRQAPKKTRRMKKSTK